MRAVLGAIGRAVRPETPEEKRAYYVAAGYAIGSTIALAVLAIIYH